MQFYILLFDRLQPNQSHLLFIIELLFFSIYIRNSDILKYGNSTLFNWKIDKNLKFTETMRNLSIHSTTFMNPQYRGMPDIAEGFWPKNFGDMNKGP